MERRLEEAALNAWPAAQQLLVGGWVVRFANGYTKRANSATPLYDLAADLGRQVAACERLYRQQNQPSIFRLPSFVAPAALDDLLADRGYTLHEPTQVLTLDLGSPVHTPSTAAHFRAASLDRWLAEYSRLSNVSAEQQALHQEILARIVPQHIFATLVLDAQVVACGLGVLEDDLFGLFDIVVDPAHRRRGLGAHLVAALLGWATDQDARHAYLQVVAANVAARRLYSNLGFREAYSYHYRVGSATQHPQQR